MGSMVQQTDMDTEQGPAARFGSTSDGTVPGALRTLGVVVANFTLGSTPNALRLFCDAPHQFCCIKIWAKHTGCVSHCEFCQVCECNHFLSSQKIICDGAAIICSTFLSTKLYDAIKKEQLNRPKHSFLKFVFKMELLMAGMHSYL